MAPQAPVPPANEAPAQPGELGTPDFPFPWNEPPADSPLEQRVARQEIEIEQLRKEVAGPAARQLLYSLCRGSCSQLKDCFKPKRLMLSVISSSCFLVILFDYIPKGLVEK